MIDQKQVTEIQANLLNWYQRSQRELPWRRDKDPYKIWVSEIMLQQTRVETVIPYFERFMQLFPTLQSLASAEEEQVIKAWEGLGYYSRARHLHAAVKEVVAKHRGQVPSDPEQLSSLKGIGPYTTGAILSIAFNQKWPAVDGNVLRVFSRLFALSDNIALSATRKKFERIADEIIPSSSPGDFNQALMELGATICKPTSPTCLLCPVREQCAGFKQGKQTELPVKSKAKAPIKVPVVCLWISEGEHVLLEKRGEQGLLGGMWALPTLEEVPEDRQLENINAYLKKRGIQEKEISMIGNYEHIFTHRHWKITLIAVKIETDLINKRDDLHWVEASDLSSFAIANVYRKAFSFISHLALS